MRKTWLVVIVALIACATTATLSLMRDSPAQANRQDIHIHPQDLSISAPIDISTISEPGLNAGISVFDLETGVAASNQGDQPFYSASVSKLLLAVDVISGNPSDRDRDLLRLALSASDDNAMNELWWRYGGATSITPAIEKAKLTGTHPANDSSQWGEVTTTADDIVRVYHYIRTELPSEQRDFIVSALNSAPDIAADGFNQAFGLLQPSISQSYAKQGWMYFNAKIYLHSAGIVDDRYIVAILTDQPTVDLTQATERVNSLTSALLSKLNQ